MSYYDDSYFVGTPEVVKASIDSSLVWMIIALVVAVIGGIALYFTVFNKKNDGKYNGFMAKLYDLVHFKYFVIDDLFRVLYLISAIAVTLLSLQYLANWRFLVILVGGNLALRISFEFFMLFMELCHNVRNIANKSKK